MDPESLKLPCTFEIKILGSVAEWRIEILMDKRMVYKLGFGHRWFWVTRQSNRMQVGGSAWQREWGSGQLA